MHSETHDILVVGAGIAGLSFALHCANSFKDKKIVVLSKGSFNESNTQYAQGGIAAVMDHLRDSYDQHINDTLKAGDYLCDPEIVKMVVEEAPAQMLQLIDWGVNFDRSGTNLELGLEGGHSSNRVVHCKDHTGASISATLLSRCRQNSNIELRENHYVLELLQSEQQNECKGAIVHNGEEIYVLQSHYAMLACGGAGRIYQSTSNPTVATGDGMALAIRAGAELKNMAFVQFHPTVFYEKDSENQFLISEAVRGYGAVLRNDDGREFMYLYDSRGSLATRDVVSRAIATEMTSSGNPHVWLDLRDLNLSEFQLKFPTIAKRLLDAGIDISKEMVPVAPAAHYFCGGVATDSYGKTSISRLMACGECAYTGLHGANRLASNSLLEALVFAKRAADKLQEDFTPSIFQKHSIDRQARANSTKGNSYDLVYKKLQAIMTAEAGIVRTDKGLKKARRMLENWLMVIPESDNSITGNELRNQLLVSLAVVNDSLRQNKNRGCFYREDPVQRIVSN